MHHPPTVILADLEIDLLLRHTLISAGSVTDLLLGFTLASALRARCPRYIYLLCVVLSSVFVLPAIESLPLFEEMGFVVSCGWVGYRFGLKCICFLDGFEVFLVCEFVCSLLGVSFLWVALLWRLLVRGIQACGFSVLSTHCTERCFYLYSNWFAGWAGSAGFGKRDVGWTGVRGFCLDSMS